MTTVRVGVIGAGAIARRAYLPGLADPASRQAQLGKFNYAWGGCDGAQVVALADVNENALRQLAETFAVPETYRDWERVATHPDLDAVCITTPNRYHAEMAIACLENGKHVMVEKPMATTLREADAMIAAAHASGKLLMVHFNWRFLPVVEAAKDALDAGAIGAIHLVRAHSGLAGVEFWDATSKWRLNKSDAGRGAMFDMGIHKADLIRWMANKEVQRVAAFSKSVRYKTDVDDLTVAVLEFTDGTVGTLEGSWVTNPWEISMFCYGDGGNMKMAWDLEPPVRFDLRTPQSMFLNETLPAGTYADGKFIPAIAPESRHHSPLAYFIRCIREQLDPLVTAEDGRKSLEIVLAIYRAASEGCIVDLPYLED